MNPGKPAISIASKNFSVCMETAPIRTLIRMLIANRSRRVAVVDNNGEFKGFVTDLDVLGYLGGDEKYNSYVTNKMKETYKKTTERKKYGIDSSVKNIMNSNVHTLTVKQTVRQALDAFKKTGQDAFPILNKKRKVLGILSNRNLVEAVYKQASMRSSRGSKLMIKHIMVKPMIVKEKFPINEVANMMCFGKFRRFPVTNNKILTGMVTAHDLLYFLSVNRGFEQLKTEKEAIKKIANRNVVSIGFEKPVRDAIKIMLAKKIGAIPVTDGEEIKGIVTFTDVLDIIH
ncbi:MAG: CBS domain-containing protein [Nanoarchaeota archaeon]